MIEHVLLWDIDGTLLTTRGAGIHAWEQALADIAGVAAHLETGWMSGLTDIQIAQRLLDTHRPDAPRATRDALVRAYEDALPAALPMREGRVLDGVTEVLDALSSRADVCSMLLTGNTRRGAFAKLDRYGLSRYFPSEGAFADGSEDRRSIAIRARGIAARLAPGAPLLIIGDTPHDIDCARHIGARVLAVATGVHSSEMLAAHGPDALREHLPMIDELLALSHGQPEVRLG